MEVRIKEQYKGQVLSNKNIPRLIVDEIKEIDYNFISKMGFSFLFEPIIEEKVIVKKKTIKK